MERQDSLTNFEHWRDLAQAHPWPLGIALLSVLWTLILIPWPHTPDAQRDLVGDDKRIVAERVLDANAHDELPADGVVIARHIRIVGHVLLSDPTVLIANEIEFAPDARIWAPSGHLTRDRAAHFRRRIRRIRRHGAQPRLKPAPRDRMAKTAVRPISPLPNSIRSRYWATAATAATANEVTQARPGATAIADRVDSAWPNTANPVARGVTAATAAPPR